MSRLAPINFQKWIDEHRHLLKPPVGNAQIWEDAEFMVTVVGGPNSRTDFHIDPGEEFFYQLEGDITLKVIDQGKHVDVPIRQGEILLLPAFVPALAAPPREHARPGDGAQAPAERARRAAVVLPELRDEALRGVLPPHEPRHPAPARVRALLREREEHLHRSAGRR